MDTLSLFAAVVAVVFFPGGMYACAAAGGAAWAGRMRPARSTPWSAEALAGAALLLFAAALIPMPQSPAGELPTGGGAPPNLLAAMLLVAAGVALGGTTQWPKLRIAAAAAAAIPPLVLAAQAATLSFPTVVALPGPHLAAARALAATAILLAAPLLAELDDEHTPRPLRALKLAVPALFAATLLAPPGWSNIPSAAAAALVLAGIPVYAAATTVIRRAGALPLSAFATSAAIAAIVVTVLASR